MFLPPYFPSLNATEEFWLVCKSKVKRTCLSSKDQLTCRAKEVIQSIARETKDSIVMLREISNRG